MILVKIYWNTDENGIPVPNDIEDGPISYYGPFDTIIDAISWMDNDYPDNDADIHDMVADDFDVPQEWLNDPSMFQDGMNVDPEHPDLDIRDDSQEIHVP